MSQWENVKRDKKDIVEHLEKESLNPLAETKHRSLKIFW